MYVHTQPKGSHKVGNMWRYEDEKGKTSQEANGNVAGSAGCEVRWQVGSL